MSLIPPWSERQAEQALAGSGILEITILAELTEWGGTEVHTAELACALDRRGHRVTIVELDHSFGRAAFERALAERRTGVTLKRIELPVPLPQLGLARLLRLLAPVRGDLCVYPKGSLSSGTWRLDLAARLLFPRLITIEHLASAPPPIRSSRRHFGLLPGLGLWWHAHMQARRIRALGPSRIVCVSDAVRRGLACYGFPEPKLRTIHNGIDTERFQRLAECRRRLRSEWGVPERALVFGAIGRFNPQKGFDLLIELFDRLVRRHPDRELRLFLAGTGDMQAELERGIAERGLADRVLLQGFTDRPWEVYSGLDLFVMPSRYEGLPFALLEAMACQCVPIAMGVGGVPEVLTDPAVGWLVPAGDETCFLQSMEAALDCTAGRLQQMAAAARAHVAGSFNAASQYAKIVELIEHD